MTVDSKMLEDQAVELEDSANKVMSRKRKLNKMVDNGHAAPAKLIDRIILSLTKPSSVLGLGPKTGSKNVRWENRVRLCHLLRKLLRRHDWIELGGVLSMILKGTCNDRSSTRNRLKYSVSMELLKHMKGDHITPNRIKNIYDVWMRKNGSMKEWPLEDRFLVHLEFILFCLAQQNAEEAHQAAQCLEQEGELGIHPMSNLVMGLIYYELWYSTIPKEMQWKDSNQFYSPQHSDMGTRFSYPDRNSEWYNANDTCEAGVPFQCDSYSSVNDNQLSSDADIDQQRDTSMERENPMQDFQPQDFIMDCNEKFINETSSSNHDDHIQYASNLFALRGLDTWLLPLQLPDPTENCEDFLDLHRKMLNDYHRNAVKYFQLALHATPPLLVALLPLIQLLLIGGQVDKALHELEKICCNSSSALSTRLRATIFERFDHNNSVMLSACFEDSLKKDPTCCHSLGKLVRRVRS
ncbi:uncharacterized protein LOC132175473 isoform X2 [Corylus avellana]|uniref:uncharacterized protein LOC132175473 isoform X2 n=1 Tax=Corylus avellana TaxID=13451 RepID=UPI00286B1DDD|nr:uncharacterized protein LOC132175473 isoform X2 [Corylus avellana]